MSTNTTKSNKLPRKKPSPNNRGRLHAPEKHKMEDRLKDIFLQGGITAYQATIVTGYDFRTVKRLFIKWADELVSEENREPWLEREKRVRQRALEGLSSRIGKIRERLHHFESILDQELKKKETDDDKIELYEKIVRLNLALDADLTQQYDSIEMTPPTEEVILKEIEKLIARKTDTFNDKNLSVK